MLNLCSRPKRTVTSKKKKKKEWEDWFLFFFFITSTQTYPSLTSKPCKKYSSQAVCEHKHKAPDFTPLDLPLTAVSFCYTTCPQSFSQAGNVALMELCCTIPVNKTATASTLHAVMSRESTCCFSVTPLRKSSERNYVVWTVLRCCVWRNHQFRPLHCSNTVVRFYFKGTRCVSFPLIKAFCL